MSDPGPKYFKAWIIFFVIVTVGGFLIGAVAGGVLGMILGVAHVDLTVIKLVCGFVGLLLSVPVSYFTFRWTVGEFIVKPLAQPPPVAPAAPPPAPPQNSS